MKMRAIHRFAIAAALAVVATSALAQNSGGMQGMNMQGMSGMNMQNMIGMHNMAATVTTLDPKTGIVEVSAGGMNLRLHFPPASLANVKVGDSITVQLAFTKP